MKYRVFTAMLECHKAATYLEVVVKVVGVAVAGRVKVVAAGTEEGAKVVVEEVAMVVAGMVGVAVREEMERAGVVGRVRVAVAVVGWEAVGEGVKGTAAAAVGGGEGVEEEAKVVLGEGGLQLMSRPACHKFAHQGTTCCGAFWFHHRILRSPLASGKAPSDASGLCWPIHGPIAGCVWKMCRLVAARQARQHVSIHVRA